MRPLPAGGRQRQQEFITRHNLEALIEEILHGPRQTWRYRPRQAQESLKAAKGYYGRRKNTIRVAKQAVEKAQQYAYRDRKRRKRNFRALWIQRINAAVREHGLTYGRFINGLTNLGIEVDRKVLSDIAINDPAGFKALVDKAAKAASSPVAKADQEQDQESGLSRHCSLRRRHPGEGRDPSKPDRTTRQTLGRIPPLRG